MGEGCIPSLASALNNQGRHGRKGTPEPRGEKDAQGAPDKGAKMRAVITEQKRAGTHRSKKK